MIAIVRMGMVVYTAGPVIINMRRDDQQDGRYQQP